MPVNEYDATGRMIRSWDEEKAEYKRKYGSGIDWLLAQAMEIDAGFQKAMIKTRKNEGGYNNDPADPGLETKYGITKKWYPEEDIKNLSRERADYILYRDFYKKPGIELLPDGIRDVVFDKAVVQGQGTAIKNLQRAVGAKADGRLGSQSLRRINEYESDEVIDRFLGNSENRFSEIEARNPRLKKYSIGWRNRLQE